MKRKRFVDDYFYFDSGDNFGIALARYTCINPKLLRLKNKKFFLDVAYASDNPYDTSGLVQIEEMPLPIFQAFERTNFNLLGQKISYDVLPKDVQCFFSTVMFNDT